MDDKELLTLLKHNPEEGLGYLINQYTNLIYSIVSNKVSSIGSTEDVKECVSDVITAFYEQINRINLDKGSIKSYLVIIAKNKAIDYYRKLIKIATKSTNMSEELFGLKDDKTNLEEAIIKQEEKKKLLVAIDSLGEPDREIFIRKYYIGQKTKEIAEILSLRHNTVDKKVSRGLEKLRNLLGGV
ncbi:RNA polymerase sigma-70 factor (ECF subfamily) [Natranaerovirga pectinivora]|uniref:RNA polymerase sigma-70 factor (ECF subfamily) n=1 Tax=Natranaerovirga pectinivora TaxID=682400 RepID=A0A4R3MM00_9FIRM|nr:sigma-70 family RNA polymerase sigma factor [Natranaerovirga pectinivora]TCT12958.1 RNA polymerase sigma-70 factor (ECF subfamily) [Natranaerovirga pectinivora]